MIVVNGEPQAVGDGESVAALLERLGLGAAARGVAIAVDGQVLPRGTWPDHQLAPGARVEIVTAMQGG